MTDKSSLFIVVLATFVSSFSVKKISTYCFLVVTLLAAGFPVWSQTLNVDANYNPQQLIEDILIGQGVQVSNIQFTGNADSKGYFDGTNSNIGLASGVIISTGRAVDAEGPNGTPVSDTGTEFNEPGDAQLTAISGSPWERLMLQFWSLISFHLQIQCSSGMYLPPTNTCCM